MSKKRRLEHLQQLKENYKHMLSEVKSSNATQFIKERIHAELKKDIEEVENWISELKAEV